MFKKTMKRITCGALALASVAACGSTLAACETSHPEVEMVIEFEGETYTLDYTLYRKVAPTTVNHFIWLAENGYYDGLCVHDYDADNLKMYTGAYSVATEEDDEDGLAYKDYYDFVKNSSDYGNFPHSVWRDEDKTMPLYTLYGEFESNKVTVENGALKESFGTLTMYYNSKTTIERVYGKRVDGEDGEVSKREYKYNSATSMFYISMVTTETATSDYCTFAKLDEDSVSVLEDLQAAINAYVGEEEDDEFTSAHTVRVDEDDMIVGETVKEVKFDVPNSPIVIKSVKVTKY